MLAACDVTLLAVRSTPLPVSCYGIRSATRKPEEGLRHAPDAALQCANALNITRWPGAHVTALWLRVPVAAWAASMQAQSVEEAKKRRDHLAKMRSLLFHQETKLKHLAKIKSKDYHRRAQKAARAKARSLQAPRPTASSVWTSWDANRLIGPRIIILVDSMKWQCVGSIAQVTARPATRPDQQCRQGFTLQCMTSGSAGICLKRAAAAGEEGGGDRGHGLPAPGGRGGGVQAREGAPDAEAQEHQPMGAARPSPRHQRHG